ncbi:MAG: peptidase S10 [Bacteroidota bacterium]
MRILPFALLLIFGWSLATTVNAQMDEPKRFVTQHRISIGKVMRGFTAVAEETILTNEEGQPAASIWSTSYLLSGVGQPSSRPVMFVFNGGPGSASVWLHMGLFGPKLVQVASEADEDDGAPPYPLINNPDNLLDLVDLVFIDPVGTGYSVVLEDGKESDYWGLNEDAASIAQFIRLWVAKHQRWNAPKFIAGESFGTTRAAGVARALHGGGQDMALNGLVLISQALDYTGSTPELDNFIAYLTYLPTMAATAWYHKKVGTDKTLEAFVEEARQFTYDEYAPALLRGSTLSEADRQTIAGRLAYFTGLNESYILRSNLRVGARRFRKELLRNEGLTLGGLDSRYALEEYDQTADQPSHSDAASAAISSAYTAAMQQHFSQTLKVEMDRPYLTSNRSLYPQWKWRPVPEDEGWEPSYVNVAPHLSWAMRTNQEMQVMVANGYYDLVTPFFDAEYTFHRHGILMDRVQMRYYEGGHMMYTRQKELTQLSADIRSFLKGCLQQ